jgi:uncharacterized membrane protein YeaQ/YmgE (transglycosylase-associated protein family)
MVGWIVVGLLTSVTGELILPGRNPAGIDIALLLGAAGSLLARFVVGLLRGAESTRFGVEAILWATLGAFAVLAIYRFVASLRAR